ncbi:fumarylacetoacetate hydrolase family protein [Paenarthrobacter nicotinovorans]|uniref:fumarylacetoacetate hydrolase family protein n=1 Tax=Paenarthrobacter nicotinovorans TaxID=29320 RepID=UPI0037FCB908
MKLATLRTPGSTIAVRIEESTAIEIPGFTDVGELLANPLWRHLSETADGAARDIADSTDWAPVVPRPSKVVCVGLNYANHIREMGRDLPEYPTLFAKYPEALIGANDPIVLPGYAAENVDWEGELAVIVGKSTRRADLEEAEKSIAGYAVLNDVTMRDYQYRTGQWFQGKTFEATTPFGPYLVTADEFKTGSEIRTEVDGETVQKDRTDDLVFGPAQLVSYISHIFTLNPGDVIATGTPGGVGQARSPKRFLERGQILQTGISGLGLQTNRVS